jgi:hypothetical protein
MSIKILWAMVLLALLAVSPALAQAKSQAPQTKSITIGEFTYHGSIIRTFADGSIGPFSDYRLALDASGITADPITFGNVIFRVKGSSSDTKHNGFPTISTWFGCVEGSGLDFACDLLITGANKTGFQLPACATISNGVLIQNCVSIAVQLLSVTGNNFSFQLADGETFCAAGITNVFVEAKANQIALDGNCDINNFCPGESAPVVLHALPIQNCN